MTAIQYPPPVPKCNEEIIINVYPNHLIDGVWTFIEVNETGCVKNYTPFPMYRILDNPIDNHEKLKITFNLIDPMDKSCTWKFCKDHPIVNARSTLEHINLSVVEKTPHNKDKKLTNEDKKLTVEIGLKKEIVIKDEQDTNQYSMLGLMLRCVCNHKWKDEKNKGCSINTIFTSQDPKVGIGGPRGG